MLQKAKSQLRARIRELQPSPWTEFWRNAHEKNCKLLNELDRYENAILVSGCQRSGTTMLARIFNQSPSISTFQTTKDDEYDAAMILSGQRNCSADERYCFQSTYINGHFEEYLEHSNYKIVWVIRNPHSVIYSMLYNWRRSALDELFLSCGTSEMDESDNERYRNYGLRGISRLKRAAYAYNGKCRQLHVLSRNLGNRIAVTDYDELVTGKDKILPKLFEFVELDYDIEYSEMATAKSKRKQEGLSKVEKNLVTSVCTDAYTEAQKYL